MADQIQDRHILDQEYARQIQPVEKKDSQPDYRDHDAFEKLMNEDLERMPFKKVSLETVLPEGVLPEEVLAENSSNADSLPDAVAASTGFVASPQLTKLDKSEDKTAMLSSAMSPLGQSMMGGAHQVEGKAASSADIKADFIAKVNQIASQIELSANAMGSQNKMTIHLKESILSKTQVSIEKTAGGDFKIQFTTASQESLNLLQMHQSSLVQQLNTGAQKFDVTDILEAQEEQDLQDGQGDGQSKGEYVPLDEDEQEV